MIDIDAIRARTESRGLTIHSQPILQMPIRDFEGLCNEVERLAGLRQKHLDIFTRLRRDVSDAQLESAAKSREITRLRGRLQWINPDDLSECGLPGADEITGSLDWSIDDIREFMNE